MLLPPLLLLTALIAAALRLKMRGRNLRIESEVEDADLEEDSVHDHSEEDAVGELERRRLAVPVAAGLFPRSLPQFARS